MGRAKLALEVAERRREVGVRVLDLDEEPRLAISNDHEVDLALGLVAHVAQLEDAEPEILPALDRLEQLTADERLGARAEVGDRRPVAREPLGLLAQRG